MTQSGKKKSSIELSPLSFRIAASILDLLLFVLTLGLGWLIWSFSLWKNGETPGKKIFHIRVLMHGSNKKAGRAVMASRQLLVPLSVTLFALMPAIGALVILAYLLAEIQFYVFRDKRTLTDRWAKTIVISDQLNRNMTLGRLLARAFKNNLIRIYACIAFIYLLVPIFYTVAFSFNDGGRSNLIWKGFTFDNWMNPCGAPEVCTALGNSIKIGFLATLFSTILGTMIAFAIGRHKFRGRSSTNLLIFLPMATPEIVLGASMLSLFLTLKINPGFWPTVIAHVMFCISFVVVTVKARIASLDPRLEQAAMDLYANEVETFRRVTFPLVAPGIAGAALLAFSLSFDDFIITNFNSGTMTTFPKFVYVSAARGIPPQANVIGSAMFIIALAVVILGQIVGRKRAVK